MMEAKTFNDYEKACIFRDKVDGQTQWCSHRSKPYWIVWFDKPTKIIKADK